MIICCRSVKLRKIELPSIKLATIRHSLSVAVMVNQSLQKLHRHVVFELIAVFQHGFFTFIIYLIIYMFIYFKQKLLRH